MHTEADILNHKHTFAVVGVSQDPAKYGHELFEALFEHGYKVYLVNPKYERIDNQICYPSLEALPEKPEVVVTAISPAVTEKIVESCVRLGIGAVWMPPGSWSDQAVGTCLAHQVQEVHDVCLVSALHLLKE